MEIGICRIDYDFVRKIIGTTISKGPKGIGTITFNNDRERLKSIEGLSRRAKVLGATVLNYKNAVVVIHGANITVLAPEFEFYKGDLFSVEPEIFKYASNYDIDNVIFEGNIMVDANQGRLLSKLKVKNLDLRGLNFKNLEKADHLFYDTKIDKVIFNENTDFSKVYNMESIFEGSIIKQIDLSKFKSCKPTNLCGAFALSNINNGYIDISNWDLSRLDNTSTMFYKTTVNEIKLPMENIGERSRSVRLVATFRGLKLDTLELPNLGNYNITERLILDQVFKDSEISTLDLSRIELPKNVITNEMFSNAKIARLIIKESVYNKLRELDDIFKDSIIATIVQVK